MVCHCRLLGNQRRMVSWHCSLWCLWYALYPPNGWVRERVLVGCIVRLVVNVRMNILCTVHIVDISRLCKTCQSILLAGSGQSGHRSDRSWHWCQMYNALFACDERQIVFFFIWYFFFQILRSSVEITTHTIDCGFGIPTKRKASGGVT